MADTSDAKAAGKGALSALLSFFDKYRIAMLILAGVLVLYVIAKVAGNSSASSSGASDDSAEVAAETSLAEQQQQLQATQDANNQAVAAQAAQTAAAAASQTSSQNYQLAGISEEGQIQTQEQANQINGQIQLAGIQANTTNEETAGQLALGEAETNANVQIANIVAGENVAINSNNNQTQQVISTNQANVGIAQTGALTTIAGDEAGASETSSIIGGVVKLASFF